MTTVPPAAQPTAGGAVVVRLRARFHFAGGDVAPLTSFTDVSSAFADAAGIAVAD